MLAHLQRNAAADLRHLAKRALRELTERRKPESNSGLNNIYRTVEAYRAHRFIGVGDEGHALDTAMTRALDVVPAHSTKAAIEISEELRNFFENHTGNTVATTAFLNALLQQP